MPKVHEWVKEKENLQYDILKDVGFSYPSEYQGYLKIGIRVYKYREFEEVERAFRETVCDSPWLILEQDIPYLDTVPPLGDEICWGGGE